MVKLSHELCVHVACQTISKEMVPECVCLHLGLEASAAETRWKVLFLLGSIEYICVSSKD